MCNFIQLFSWRMIYNATELILIMSKDPKVTSGDAKNETLVVPGKLMLPEFPKEPLRGCNVPTSCCPGGLLVVHSTSMLYY